MKGPGWWAPRIGLAVLGGVCLLVALSLIAAPVFLRSPSGLKAIESLADGLPAGRLGHLVVEGVSGDPLRELSVRRVALRDSRGVWLEARSLKVDWDPSSLLSRTVEIRSASATLIRVLRAPVLRAPQPEQSLPVTVSIGRFGAVIESEPAATVRRGAFRVNGALELRRDDGGLSLRLDADSLLASGDHLDLAVELGPDRPLALRASALEAQGGAIAGALGLPSRDPFRLTLIADGAVARGRVEAELSSGSLRPVFIKGGWTPEDGHLSGEVDLSASTLTRPLSERIGEILRLKGQAKGLRDDPGRYEGRLSLSTEAAELSLAGQVDIEGLRTGPEGLVLQGSAPSLGRIAGVGEGGAFKINGRLEGKADDWGFEGRAGISGYSAMDYSLGNLAGPLKLALRNERLDLDLSARGVGGRGSGLLPALLGPRPVMELKASRLADGALLIEDLEAEGAGFRVTGAGSRGLLGGLSFSGTASISRLDLGLPGARGRLTGQWRARSESSQAPWNVAFEARGEGLRTGQEEVDRLLGGRPAVDARFRLKGEEVQVENLDLVGASVRASAKGGVLAAGRTDLGFEWSASGPFRAGPVEVAGKASGTGRITGPLASPQVQMGAGFDVIELPGLQLTAARLELNWTPDGGSAEVRAASRFGPAMAAAEFAFPGGNVSLRNIRVDGGGVRAGGEAILAGGAASRADLMIEVTRGALLSEGSIRGSLRLEERTRSGLWLDADLVARNALSPGETVSIAEGRFRAEGPLDRLTYNVNARGETQGGDWRLDGTGLATRAGSVVRIGFDGSAEAAGREVRTTETARIDLEGSSRSGRLRLALEQGGLASLDFSLGPEAAEILGRVDDLPAAFLNPDLAGKLNVDFRIRGQAGRLVGASSGRLSDVRARDSEVALGLNGRFAATLSDEEVRVQADLGNAQGMTATSEVTLPVKTRLSDLQILPDRERPLRGEVRANGEIKPLWDLLVGGEQSLSGVVRMTGVLGGTLAAPRAQGEAEIENGAFSDAATGLVLKNVIVRSRLSENEIRIDRATGADGQGGVLSGSGVIALQEGAASSFRLDLLNFRVIDNELATALASGQASMTRAADGRVTLKGGLTINRADVTASAPTPTGVTPLAVTEINRPVRVGRGPAVQDIGPAVALDVTLKAPQQVYIRGQGLDLEMSLDARVTGTTARPRLTGLARVIRGSYAFADKRFEIDPSGVVYLSQDPARIRLDLAAVRADPALTATVRIRGTAVRPEVTLTSTPALPTDEIFSQILFGRSASQLSPLETAQLASAVASMAGGGALDVIGNLRGLAGLDRLTFAGGTDEDGVQVSGGKYLTDNVLLIVTGGGREGGSAQVEWNVSRSLSLISKLSGQGGNTLSVRWRRDY